jgi:hypothetical protein
MRMYKGKWGFPLMALLLGFGLSVWLITTAAQTEAAISGIVLDAAGPVSGAVVRIRATETETVTGADGSFTLAPVDSGGTVELTAWQDGYYITSTMVTPPATGITLILRAYHTVDHPDYEWVSPIVGSSDHACGECHPMILPQWENNAHGQAIENGRFYSLYNGTNVSGTVQIGAGYLNDFPGTAGNCANCHAPGAAIDGYLTTNMNDYRGDVTAGIHCDYCHKVGGVYIDPATNSIYPNMPGARSQIMLRPPAGEDIFFGPFDDIKDPDTYVPIYDESQYCAACHQFSFWGTPIYESYAEWLASPYAEAGVTCQICHMHPNGDRYFASPEVGGQEHPPEKIPSHLQPGAADVELLQNSVEMSLTAVQQGTLLHITVGITNTGVGHHIPTDFPGRQMILLVQAEDGMERPLPLLTGPTIPVWGGDEAGLPGIIYAKLLRDVESGAMPVVSYWKQTVIAADNRIPAMEADQTTYSFILEEGLTAVDVTARLIFRRVFDQVAEEKAWEMADIEMENVTAHVDVKPITNYFIPLVRMHIQRDRFLHSVRRGGRRTRAK